MAKTYSLAFNETVRPTETFPTPEILYGWDATSFTIYLFIVAVVATLVPWLLRAPRRWPVSLSIAAALIVVPLVLLRAQPVRQVLIPLFRWVVQ